MENKTMIIPVILALLIISCVHAGPVRLTEADNGSTNSLKAGGEIEIVLKGNPTTGYAWDLCSFASNKLEQVKPAEYRQDAQPGKNLMVGVGGKFVFRFKAVQEGEGNIRLIYRRSWETTAYDKVYSVVFDVK
jgi:inhibitor of cysteine peptidase